MNIEFLVWDSEFFQKKTGRINFNETGRNQLMSVLLEARLQGFNLLYIFSPEDIFIENDILSQFNGTLVDKKVVYRLNLQTASIQNSIVEEYTSTELVSELEQLAFLSGTFSRYYKDTNFLRQEFYNLYKSWITRSIKKELADNIFVIKEKEKIVGMVTLKKENTVGRIGLIAISESAQKKGYGWKLIEACTKSLISNDIYTLDVTTQLFNLSACQFYEKCGFKKISITNIYHLWL